MQELNYRLWMMTIEFQLSRKILQLTVVKKIFNLYMLHTGIELLELQLNSIRLSYLIDS